MIGVNSLHSSDWNAVINAINSKAKEAYVEGDNNLSETEAGIAEVKAAMNEMVDAFNEANIYVNFMDDLLFYYRQSRQLGRNIEGVRSKSLAGVNIVPDRGKIE